MINWTIFIIARGLQGVVHSLSYGLQSTSNNAVNRLTFLNKICERNKKIYDKSDFSIISFNTLECVRSPNGIESFGFSIFHWCALCNLTNDIRPDNWMGIQMELFRHLDKHFGDDVNKTFAIIIVWLAGWWQ